MTRSHLPTSMPTSMPTSIVATVVGAAVVSAIGLTSAFASDDSTVQLTVDGQTRTVSLDGETVADVLADQDLEAGEHDLLSPAADTELEDGDAIALRRATELSLTVDGKARTVHVLADTVDAALAQVGLKSGVYVSASRSRALTDGLALEVRTPKRVGILADGNGLVKTSTAATVGEMLAQSRLVLRPGDTVVPAPSTPLRAGLVAKVVRTVNRVESVAQGTRRVSDPDAYVGTRTTVSAGTPGKVRKTYEIRTVTKGTQRTEVVASRVLVAPVPAVVEVGTKPRPAPAPRAVTPTSTEIPRSGGLNWAALAQCESGGNPRTNTGNGYYGLYQFSLPTWRSVGGSGLPSDASAAEQTRRAQILYDRSGPGQWPTCGKRL